MRILVIGGSGKVGGLVLPALARKHELRIYDLRPPRLPMGDYIAGDVANYGTLLSAAEGMDALLYMAMGLDNRSPEAAASAFDVNVKGLYLALLAAHDSGISHAVYTSTMSIYSGNLEARYFADEDVPADATEFYGFTKHLGEQVCRNACREWGLSANALRLCGPTADDEWMAQAEPNRPTIATAASDLARALLAALEYRDGFQAIMISGDYQQQFMDLGKARRLLAWEPQARPSAPRS